ncbi:MAG TPA: aldolase/citrate lyase family protein [Ktedonobacterales bacterium]|nr:aldolase/citrate lyase family protein [Ktedonobacterales bacterium]
MTAVRISAASPEADLRAALRPGVSTVFYSRAESAAQLRAADGLIAELERLRGIRPGTVRLQPLIETPHGISRVHEIAAASKRCVALGLGPHVHTQLGGDSLAYARGECELTAHALELAPMHIDSVRD